MRSISKFSRLFHPAVTLSFAVGLLAGIVGTTAGASVLGSRIFEDVPAGSYYDAAVGEMYERGVIKGYNSKEFGPDDFVTRAQVAVMMKRMRDDLLSGGITASARSSAVSSAGSSASVYVNPRGTFQFNASTYSIREGSGNAALTITRTNANTGEITLRYTITAGSASKGSDFEGEDGTLTFADKQTSKVLTIGTLNDSSVEDDETFTVTITDVGRAVKGSPATAIVTIVDDDGASSASAAYSSQSVSSTSVSLQFSAATYAVTEAGGTLTVSVQRTGPATGTVSVAYATGGGSAVAGSDYTTTNGTLSFGAGDSVKVISIPITDNASVQGNKTFVITLSSPTGGAKLGTQKSATVSIVDDENESISFGTGSLKFAKSDYVVDEEERMAFITVQRMGGAKGTVGVKMATSDLSAISTADYTAQSTTLTFAPFETSKVIAIPIVEDTTNENDEIFSVTISNPTGGAELLAPSTTSVTITD